MDSESARGHSNPLARRLVLSEKTDLFTKALVCVECSKRRIA